MEEESNQKDHEQPSTSQSARPTEEAQTERDKNIEILAMDRQRELAVELKPKKFMADILKCHEEDYSILNEQFKKWLQEKQQEDEACRMVLEDRQGHNITGKRTHHKHQIEYAVRKYMKNLKGSMGDRQREERVKIQMRKTLSEYMILATMMMEA